MASAEDLRQQIQQVRRELAEAQQRTEVFEAEVAAADERQKLRRELEAERQKLQWRNSINIGAQRRRQLIDGDLIGEHMKSGSSTIQPHFSNDSPRDGIIEFNKGVKQGEYTWKLSGMSWLENALEHSDDLFVWSDEFSVGGSVFELVYSPNKVPLDDSNDRVGSLALRHLQPCGIILRYKMFIKRAGGDFVQWGVEANECHPSWDEEGKAFGPDVQEETEGRPFGIFGLKHDDLVQSEWVENDTLTVKVQVQVLETIDTETKKLETTVVVPPATLTADLLAMLEGGICTDTTFIVEGRRIGAHSNILAARSEVFNTELNSSMREAVSKEIEINDVDSATFDVFLRFLYTDDLERAQAMVEKLAQTEKGPLAASSSQDEETPAASSSFASILQNLMAVSHRYQVQRLRIWCEQQLCTHICKDQVCSILCQAHLYDACQLEKECLSFIKNNMEAVMSTRGFGSLSAEWPDVTLKINTFCAGVSEDGAAEAWTGLEETRKKRGAKQDTEEASPKRARSA